MTDTANAPELADWGNPQVQLVYKMICSDELPKNKEEHWDGYLARKIVAALATHCDELVAAERAKLAAIVAAQESVIKAWPRVRLILQEYDNAFPYAELEGDDEAVCALERAIRALAPDNSRATLQENADEK